MIKKFKIILLALLTVVVSSCELDLLDNPNAVTTNNTDLNYLLNRIQVTFSTHFNQFSDPGMRLTRMLTQGAAIYDNAVTAGGSDGRWTTAYAELLVDIQTLLPMADEAGLYAHAGVARTLRAFILMNLVDDFGDVPYSEALSSANFNPKVDKGADVYAAALKDLDDAMANFTATSRAGIATDLFYGGTADSWIRTANTLKLKMYLNKRLVDASGSKAGIDALIQNGKLISSAAQNFTFKFGTNLTNPDTRHPRYGGQYLPTGGGDWQSNSYMGSMYDKKDPRIRFYFYRQTITNTTNINELSCINNLKPGHYSTLDYYCVPTPVGYWGYDHLYNGGTPPDGLRRTAWGVYPAGGLFDNDAGVPVSLGAGAGGAGIHPILMQSYVDFMLAESALTLGTSGDPKVLLESAIRKSMADVRALALATTQASAINAFEASKGLVWATEVNTYVSNVLKSYDAAATPSDKLNVIATEYWFALHGNGIEAYNMYRRTGMPKNLQPGLDANVGGFVRSFYYPLQFVNRNSTAEQKANATVQVFWDTNPAGFIK